MPPHLLPHLGGHYTVIHAEGSSVSTYILSFSIYVLLEIHLNGIYLPSRELSNICPTFIIVFFLFTRIDPLSKDGIFYSLTPGLSWNVLLGRQ